MSAQKVRGKNGGHRLGAGRKRTPYKNLQTRLEAEKAADAEYGLSLFVAVMRDVTQPISLRLQCAEKVQDRVLGKSKERQEQSGNVILRVIYEDEDVTGA